MRLSDLPNGASAWVSGLEGANSDIGPDHLRRLEELGFMPGEQVRLLRRGPGGREPLAVQIGESLFALRWLEAHSVLVESQCTN